MQKVTAICLHENYRKVKSLTVVKANGDLVPLIHYNTLDLSYEYGYFEDLYKDMLRIIKINGFYVKHWRDFGADFYSINFIDTKNPNLPKVFPLRAK